MNTLTRAELAFLFALLSGLCGISVAADETTPASQILIRNVNVWDGTSDQSAAGQSVLIEGNLIKSIGDNLPVGTAATVIDGRGRVLMPGIIDAHTHLALPVSPAKLRTEDQTYLAALSVKAAERVLMHGWTTVRDIG